MRRIIMIASAAALAVSVAVPAQAKPGHLDRFFSGDGRQTAFANGGTGYGMVIDNQGRIVEAGYTLGHHTDIALARFLPNGKPDKHFGGGDGKVTTDLGATDYAFDVALHDGKIIVAGERDKTSSSQVAVLRYTSKGKLDKSFSGDGVVLTGFGKRYQGANTVTVGSNGNILVGGFASNGSNSRWALMRLGPHGGIDKHFGGGDGRVTVELSPTDEQIEDLTIANGGKIIAAGYAEASLIPRFAVAQFFTGGKLDRHFGHKGKNLIDVSKGGDIGYALGRQSNGKIVVAGFADHAGKGDWGMIRLGAKGRLDHAFGNKGIVITRFGPAYEYAYGLAIQSNDRILAAGRANRRGNADFCLARYKPNGGLDKGFGDGDGKTCTDFFHGDDTARDIAIQKNGKIVVSGDAMKGKTSRFAVARFLAT